MQKSRINHRILKFMIEQLNESKLARPIKTVVEIDTGKLSDSFVKTVDAILDDDKKSDLLSDEIYHFYLTLGNKPEKPKGSGGETKQESDIEVVPLTEPAPIIEPALEPVNALEPDADIVPVNVPEQSEKPIEINLLEDEEEQVEEEQVEEEQVEEVEKSSRADVPRAVQVYDKDGEIEEVYEIEECSGFGMNFNENATECIECEVDYPRDYARCKSICCKINHKKIKSRFGHSVEKPGGSIDLALVRGMKYNDLVQELAFKFKFSLGKVRSLISGHYTHLLNFHKVGIHGMDSVSARTPPDQFLKLNWDGSTGSRFMGDPDKKKKKKKAAKKKAAKKKAAPKKRIGKRLVRKKIKKTEE